MSYIGRKLRERRLLFPGIPRGLIVPVDHGFTVGPIPGLQMTEDMDAWVGSDCISAVLGHKGMIERLVQRGLLHPSTGVIVHLNGMPTLAPEADTKIMVSSIEAALQLGADAVSIQVNFTPKNFQQNLEILGWVTDAAHAAGLPVLTMLYDKAQSTSSDERVKRLNHLLRVVVEMGSDAVKLAFPESFADVSDLVLRHSGDIKIFFAGGEKTSEEMLLTITEAALSRGASGLCVGRNVFQHPHPTAFLRRLAQCIKGEVEQIVEYTA